MDKISKNLEEQISFMEQEISQMSNEIYLQQKEIIQLKNEINRIRLKLSDFENTAGIKILNDEIPPPHY